MTPARPAQALLRRPLGLAVLLVSALALLWGANADAATTIGSTLSVAPEHAGCGGSSTYTNTAMAGTLAAPFNGVIVRWRMDLA